MPLLDSLRRRRSGSSAMRRTFTRHNLAVAFDDYARVATAQS
jgi:hypothetical protein